jgi:hypothetical protein
MIEPEAARSGSFDVARTRNSSMHVSEPIHLLAFGQSVWMEFS